jgi:hypothetical protein
VKYKPICFALTITALSLDSLLLIALLRPAMQFHCWTALLEQFEGFGAANCYFAGGSCVLLSSESASSVKTVPVADLVSVSGRCVGVTSVRRNSSKQQLIELRVSRTLAQ